MKFLFLFLVICVASGSCSIFSGADNQQTWASKEFLHRQKNLFDLYVDILGQNGNKEQVVIGREYNIMSNINKYENEKAVLEFLHFYRLGMLPKHKIFSISYQKMRDEAVSLFHLFFYAKDYDTFYRTACWAREHLNEGLFVYALNVAVLHRHDCRGMILPAPYEVYPFFFINSEVIQKVHRLKQEDGDISNARMADFFGIHKVDNLILVNSNYSGWYLNSNEETRISYFTEDVGLNSYYYFFHADYPFWMYGENYGLNKDRRGEIYYYYHQQLLARYYMERLSNNLGEIRKFSWNWPIRSGFSSNLVHDNGLKFPSRPEVFDFRTEENLWRLIDVKDCERRIRDVVQSGFAFGEDGSWLNIKGKGGLNILGNIVQGNGDSPNKRFYQHCGLVGKSLLGNTHKPLNKYFVNPAVLEHYETALRDPMFYQLYKRLLHYFFRYKDTLPSYTREEFLFPGVQINDVNVDKLVTFFDNFDIDMYNAVYHNKEETVTKKSKYFYGVRQHRLNHNPFDVKIDVESDKATDVIVRIFLGPKYDSKGNKININKNRYNFFEMDSFLYKLNVGKQIIVRNSRDFVLTRKDRTPAFLIARKIDTCLKTDEQFPLDMSEGHNLFPDRLILPKGRENGMNFQMFVIVSSYRAPKLEVGKMYDPRVGGGIGSGTRRVDDRALGYPFDRRIDESHFYTRNMFMKDVYIYHKKDYVHDMIKHSDVGDNYGVDGVMNVRDVNEGFVRNDKF